MTKRPGLIIVVDILLALVMGPVAVWYAGAPDFSDPNKVTQFLSEMTYARR